MSRLPDLAERIERLVLRHEELQRTNALLEQQLHTTEGERDSLKSRLAAARARGCKTVLGREMLDAQLPLYLDFFGLNPQTHSQPLN